MNRPDLLVTLGDLGGVGPEVAVAAVLDREVQAACNPIVVADPSQVERAARALGQKVRVVSVEHSARGGSANEILVMDPGGHFTSSLPLGEPSREAGLTVIRTLQFAVDRVLAGAARGLVTAPSSKLSLHLAGFARGVGQTAIIEESAGVVIGTTVMLLEFGAVRAAHLTAHVPLRAVVDQISADRVRRVIQVTHDSLKARGLQHPRLAVTGINPHAGEDGVLGAEEQHILVPALRWASSVGIRAVGPLPNETVWARTAEFDAIIVPYHDAGHVPLRLIAGNRGVHLTLGLGFPRAAPLHGCAFQQAGRGTADPTAMCSAILAVASLATARPLLQQRQFG
jgi:4-hydroxythreonine-4-phosphate dehydrogenase